MKQIVEKDFKVILITQGISRIVNPLIESSINIVGMVEATPQKGAEISKKPKIKKVLKTVIPRFHKKEILLKDLAEEKNIPFYSLISGIDREFEEWVKGLKPDLIAIFSMSQLLKENIINIPERGVINLHPSLLPKYRGPLPDFWMYYNNDLNPGVTVHYIDIGEDTGDIIYQESFNMSLGTKSPDMLDTAIGEIGSKLMIKAIKDIQNGTAPRVQQPRQSPTNRARRIKLEEHKEIIRWQEWKIERIWHILRGTELWLNAVKQPMGIYKGQRWSILDFQKIDMNDYIPSKIYIENGKRFIACRDGKIFISVNFNIRKLIISFMR